MANLYILLKIKTKLYKLYIGDIMEYEIKGGAFPIVICTLKQGETMKNETGAMGVFKKDSTVQVVYGMRINAVREAVDKELGIGE